MADQQPANLPPRPASGCEIDDPNHDHDGLWWSAADELEAMCARNRVESSAAEPSQP